MRIPRSDIESVNRDEKNGYLYKPIWRCRNAWIFCRIPLSMLVLGRTILFAVIFLFTQFGVVLSEESVKITAEAILEKVVEVEWSDSSRSITKQTITTPRGKERNFTMEIYTLGGNEKQMIRYIEPAKVKGSSFLMLNEGDDIWFYTPRTGRVRKLASHMKKRRMMGSDFSYDDMGGGNWKKDFEATLSGEEKETGITSYKLKLIPTPEGPAYSKMYLWVDKERFVPLRIDYYDEDGELLKRLTVDNIEEIKGKITPMKFTMENFQRGGKTVIEIIEIEYDIDIDDKDFTSESLKK